MHWLDIVLIVVLALFALVGLGKGFFKSLMSLINVLVSLVAAIFLAKPFANLIAEPTGLLDWFSKLFTKSLNGIEGFDKVVEGSAASAKEVIKNSEGINGFFEWLLPKIVGDGTIAIGTTPAEYFGRIIGGAVLVLVCGILIYIAIRLIVGLLTKIFNKLKTFGLIGFVDRILGLAFGFLKGVIFIAIVLFIVNLIPFVNDKSVNLINNTQYTRKFSEVVEECTEKILDKVDLEKLVHF